jgi:secondary thiamine-phosphate synthase enzyme
MIYSLTVNTNFKTGMLDITNKVEGLIEESGCKNGTCTVFVPHTTAGVTINENADVTVKEDILMELNKVIPFEDGYKHKEGNSAAHIKSTIVGCSEEIIIDNGNLVLGTWQGIYFCEFDGPKTRKLLVHIIEN